MHVCMYVCMYIYIIIYIYIHRYTHTHTHTHIYCTQSDCFTIDIFLFFTHTALFLQMLSNIHSKYYEAILRINFRISRLPKLG